MENNFLQSPINKRIVHLTSAHSFNDTRIFLREAKPLANVFREVIIVAPDAGNYEVDNVRFIGFNNAVLPKGRIKRVLAISKIKKIIDEINPDLIHFHDPELLLFVPSYCRKKNIKCIFDVHEDYRATLRSNSPALIGKILAAFYNIIEKIAINSINGTIHVSPQIYDMYKKFNKPSEIVRNLPDIDKIVKITTDPCIKKPNNKLIYSGSLEQKSLFLLADAIKELSKKYEDIAVSMIGEFRKEKTKKNLIEYWKAKNVYDRLNLSSRIERDVFLRKIDEHFVGLVLFWPSDNVQVALPNKIFEFMAAGIPIVVPNCTNHKELTEKHRCGVVCDTTNSASIANAIDLLLGDKNEAIKMGARGRQACIDYYNFKTDFPKIIDLYKEVFQE